jgi:hypothetical protein
MQSIAFVVPVLPGKTETDRAAMISCWRGERREAHARARRRLGISREAVFIQPTPDGDVAVVYMESDDLDTALKGVATSDDAFDVWFREHVKDVHGVDLAAGFPPPEQIMDFSAGADG